MGYLPYEAVEKSVSGGLRRVPCRCRFAHYAQPLNETDEYSGGSCRFNTIGQLARRLRTGQCVRHPGLHGYKKARDATINFSIMASQFHGCGHQQASAPTISTARTVNVAGKVGP